MPKISILVPIYNVEEYLEKCLDSILNQTFTDFELIGMDDGSTDLSGVILDRYAQRDHRVRAVHKKNTGYGNTMNQAIQMAHGDYIGIVESDDYIASDMYESMYCCAIEHQAEMVKTDYYDLWDHEDGTEGIKYHRLTKNQSMYNRVIEPNKELEAYFLEKFTWNALYHRMFLLQNQIQYNETSGASYQDNGFWFQTFYFAKKVFFLDQAFYRYKQDNPNSSIHSTQKVYAMKNEYDYIHNFLERHQEKNRKLYQICYHFRVKGCLYTLEKTAVQYKLELARMIAEEYKKYNEQGEITWEWFSKLERNSLSQICHSPEKYVENLLRKEERVRKSVDGFHHVIIYGAGSYGRSAYCQLKKIKDLQIELAVTDLHKKKEYLYSEQIKEITDFSLYKDSSLVILAVKEDTEVYEEMKQLLVRERFLHVKTYKNCFG